MPPKKVIAQPKGRPAFVGKLWQMVNDPVNAPYIRWMPDGKSIQVVNREAFEKTLLPKYFKHANFSSFVRQLNMYGWHKVQDLQSGSMHNGDENWQFQSPNFVRGHEELLDRIVRNKGSNKQEHEEDDQDFTRVIQELETIKSKQMTIGEDLFRIRKDNELLWNEHNQNREKYEQHSQMLDKILHFLASVYGQNGGKILDGVTGPMPGTKRRFITQLPDNPSPPDGERIQEIQEMKDLQNKINTSSSHSGGLINSPGNNDGALVPFNRQMAPHPTKHQHHLDAPNNSVMEDVSPQGTGTGKELGTQISQNQDEIDTLANQLAMQDLSLQQVQDWISHMGPGEDYSMERLDPSTPADFDVNDFINTESDEPVVKQEDLTL